MQKKIVIFGASQMAEQMKILLEHETNKVIEGFIVDDEYFKFDRFCNLQVVPFSKINDVFPCNEFSVILGIGMKKMNINRERVYLSLKKRGYEVEGFVSKNAHIYTNDIGEGNIFLPNCVIAPKVKIGNANFFDINTAICHHSKIGNYNFFAVAASTAGDVTVGNSCFIASNSIIRNSIVVKDRTLVGAGAYLDKDTLEDSIFVPARGLFLKYGIDSCYNANEKNTNVSDGGGYKATLTFKHALLCYPIGKVA
ncbi:hypothetical protein [Thomasclavelia spiroformis]|uniref:hypothetical protein n=1 Tax=Thomasclavelia spiroformis TaxID=29348 RepID=UPI0024B19964|nr:hypothetical protein [Thomasclavelia spiroformis]